jgi:hypothetical protein
MPLQSTRGAASAKGFGFTAGANPFISATGGTILTCGDYKTHVFTGPGSFVVTNAGKPTGSNSVEYLVVAGGASGAGGAGGGGGAGGYRQNYPSPTTAGLPVTATTYPITVGGGGVGGGDGSDGGQGFDSIFSTITSAGGGGGGHRSQGPFPGGSGGGGGYYGPISGGTGNSPPVSPPQGNNGGNSPSIRMSPFLGSGGGGAGGVGSNQPDGPGGVGSPIATAFFGPTAPSYGTPGPAPGRYFSGGGGGSNGGSGGAGGGGASGPTGSGTTNTGGGGGCGNFGNPAVNGGSGVVFIRYKFK